MEHENRPSVPEQPPAQQIPPQRPLYGQQPQTPPPSRYPQYPQTPPKKRIAAWKIVVPILAGVLALAVLIGAYFLFLRPAAAERNGNGSAAEAEDIVGTWRFNGAVVNGETYNADEADATLVLRENRTGEITIAGVKTRLTWRFAYREDGMDHYELKAEDGTVCDLWYYGDLTLYGNEDNSINFTK